MFNTSLKHFVIVFKQKSIKRHHICLKDADYYYILDEIELQEQFEFERNVSGNSDEEYY